MCLIGGCSPNVNPLTNVRIDDKAEQAVLTEEYSQLDFLNNRVKNSAPLEISALSGCSPFSEQNLNHLLKIGAHCFAVPSDQDFLIRSRTPLDCFSWHQTCHQFQIPKKRMLQNRVRVRALCKSILVPCNKDSGNAAVRNPSLQGIEPSLFWQTLHALSISLPWCSTEEPMWDNGGISLSLLGLSDMLSKFVL